MSQTIIKGLTINGGNVTVNPKSGIAYQRPPLTGATTSYRTGDDKWNENNNPYPTPPSNPLYIQALDPSGGGAGWNTLLYNNIHGNTTRYTDSLGGAPNGVVEGTFFDHLTGLEIVYATFYGNWNDAIDHFHNLSLNGNSDYRVMNYEEQRTTWFVEGRHRTLVYTNLGTASTNVGSSSTRYDLTTYALTCPYTTGGSNFLKTNNYTYVGCRTFV